MSTPLSEILKTFNPVSLGEMSAVRLQNRVDSKFVASIGQTVALLNEVKDCYRVLEVESNRSPAYLSLYMDTEALQLYHWHHNQHAYRYKIRFRKYIDSNLCFLEVKEKIKDRTVKNRIEIQDIELNLSENSKSFIGKFIDKQETYRPSLYTRYERITLVDEDFKERITLDLDLSFTIKDSEKQLNNVCIIELKQSRINRTSKFFRALKKLGIRQKNISKYCMGIIYNYPEIKYNRFKPNLLLVDKLTKQH